MSTTLRVRAAFCVALAALAAPSATVEAKTYGSVEWLLLAPKTSSSGFDSFFYYGKGSGVETEGAYSSTLESGVRFVLGCEDCSGFGTRVRYFLFDNTVGYVGAWDGGTPLQVSGGVSVDVDALDLELTQSGRFRYWELLVSGGLRYGRVDISESSGLFDSIPAAVFFGSTGTSFEGVGPTFSLEARRPVSNTGLEIIGRGRTALLFGDVDMYSAFQDGGLVSIENEFVQVWEFQFGMGYSRDCGFGMLDLGIFWEAQRWDSDSDTIGDLGLHGLSLMGGLTF